jgi:hypothetical protein
MRVEIGPVPIESARAWIDYAAGVIAELHANPRIVELRVLESFSGYVEEWRVVADKEPGDVFRWQGEASSESVEYLVFALYRIGARLGEEANSGLREPQPPVAYKFHTVLIHNLLGALEHEGEAEAHFVQQLREVWAPANERM